MHPIQAQSTAPCSVGAHRREPFGSSVLREQQPCSSAGHSAESAKSCSGQPDHHEGSAAGAALQHSQNGAMRLASLADACVIVAQAVLRTFIAC
eukprot:1146375-Pelagomonas_calceolata.AAC.5